MSPKGGEYVFPDPAMIVTAQQMSILLEVGGEPKPGNVTPNHPFPEISHGDFLAAAASIEESLISGYREARSRLEEEGNLGGLWGRILLQAAENSVEGRSNTIFGTLLLQIPIALGACVATEGDDVLALAGWVVENSSVEDALTFTKATRICRVGGLDHEALNGELERYDLTDPRVERAIKLNGMRLGDLLSMSAKYDILAGEISQGFPIVREYAEKYLATLGEVKEPGEASSIIFCSLLATYPDSLIARRAGRAAAEDVRRRALEAMSLPPFSEGWLSSMRTLDAFLRERDLNPGSLADLTAGAIFLALLQCVD